MTGDTTQHQTHAAGGADGSTGPVVVAWIIGGALILILQRTGHIPRGATPDAPERPRLTDITHRQALIIGLAQCVALWPGTSRSCGRLRPISITRAMSNAPPRRCPFTAAACTTACVGSRKWPA